jgi:hypothetical protein
VRLQIDLLDATSGAELWGDHYDRKLADLLAVQDQISREVSQRLRATSEKVVAQPSAVSFQPSEIGRKTCSPRLMVLRTKSRPSKLHFILPTPRGHVDMKPGG